MIIRLFFFIVFCFSAPAMAQNNYQKVGEATFSFLWNDVYSSVLKTPSGSYVKGGAAILVNTYHMNFSSDELFDSTRDELARVSDASNDTLDGWMKQLAGVYPDVKEGEKIRAEYDGEESVKLFYQESPIGTLKGAEFAQAFLGIWVSEKSRSSSFSKKLRGE